MTADDNKFIHIYYGRVKGYLLAFFSQLKTYISLFQANDNRMVFLLYSKFYL